MFHGDLVNEIHVEDSGSPGFRAFLKKWKSKADDRTLFVQFTKPRPEGDKRFVGSLGPKKDPYKNDPEIPGDPKDDEDTQHEKANRAKEHLKKLGVEDKTLYREPNHSDPIGVYAYPLNYVVHHPHDIQYGADMEILRVIKVKKDKVLDLQETKPSDIEKLIHSLGWNFTGQEAMQAVRHFHENKRRGNPYSHAFWFLLQHEGKLYREDPKGHNDLMKELGINDKPMEKGLVRWAGGKDGDSSFEGETLSGIEQAKRLRKAGFDGVEDRDPSGTRAVIYHSEPEQILISSRNAYEIEDTFDLRRRHSGKKSRSNTLHHGIISNAMEFSNKQREYAEKAALGLGDKIMDRVQSQSEELRDQSGVALVDAFKLMNGSVNLSSIHITRDPVESTPTLYKTKRGMLSIYIDMGKGTPYNNHRSKGDFDPNLIRIEYADAKGVSSMTADDVPIEKMAKEILNVHPQIAWKGKEPPNLDPKNVFKSMNVITDFNRLAKIALDNSDSGDLNAARQYSHRVAKYFDSILEIAGLEKIPSDTLDDTMTTYMLLKRIRSRIGSWLHTLGTKELTWDEEGNPEQPMRIAGMNKRIDKVEALDDMANHYTADFVRAVKDDRWIYAYDSPHTMLKLRPEFKPLIDGAKWVFMIAGADTLDPQAFMEVASFMRSAHGLGKIQNMDPRKLGSDPEEHIGHEELDEAECIQVISIIKRLADELSALGHGLQIGNMINVAMRINFSSWPNTEKSVINYFKILSQTSEDYVQLKHDFDEKGDGRYNVAFNSIDILIESAVSKVQNSVKHLEIEKEIEQLETMSETPIPHRDEVLGVPPEPTPKPSPQAAATGAGAVPAGSPPDSSLPQPF